MKPRRVGARCVRLLGGPGGIERGLRLDPLESRDDFLSDVRSRPFADLLQPRFGKLLLLSGEPPCLHGNHDARQDQYREKEHQLSVTAAAHTVSESGAIVAVTVVGDVMEM